MIDTTVGWTSISYERQKHIQNFSGEFPQTENFDDEQGEKTTRTG
jgi:hypothetical protein